jgi:hypothetical protein
MVLEEGGGLQNMKLFATNARINCNQCFSTSSSLRFSVRTARQITYHYTAFISIEGKFAT